MFATVNFIITVTILKILGANLKRERIKRNLSQEELAEKAGLHRTYIGMIERAERNISLTTAEKLAKAINISVSSLFKG